MTHALPDRAGEVRVGQQDVGRLATQLLQHAFDRGGPGRRNGDAGARGTRERHHVYARVRGNGGTGNRPFALDQVEHPRRHAGLVQHLGEQRRAERREFGRLEHHGATRGQRRHDFQEGQEHGPVPGRDQAAYTDRLVYQQGGTAQALESRTLQHRNGLDRGDHAQGNLGSVRQGCRRPHFKRQRVGDLGHAPLVDLDDAPQQRHALFA